MKRRTTIGRSVLSLIALTLAAALPAAPAVGQSTYWQHDPATPGDWSDPANWTTGVPVLGGDNYAYVANGGTAHVYTDSDCQFFDIGGGSGGVASAVRQYGGTLVSGGYFWVSKGSYELIDGVLDCANQLRIVGGGSVNSSFLQTGGIWSAVKGVIGNGGAIEIQDGQAALGDLAVQQGRYVQSGGTVDVGGSFGVSYYGSGEISGGSLNAGFMFVDESSLVQTGGDVNLYAGGLRIYALYGVPAGYELSGSGSLQASRILIDTGRSTLRQSGGALTADSMEIEAYTANPANTYNLGAGTATIGELTVGKKGIVTQSGGVVTLLHSQIKEQGRYELSGGSLTVADSVDCLGTFTFGNGAAALTAGGIVSFGAGPLDGGSASVHILPESLLIVPAGFDPATGFGSYVNEGLLARAGEDIVVPAGSVVRGRGTLTGHVVVGGQLAVTSGKSIGIRGGVTVGAGASLALGQGRLDITDLRSVMAGESMTCSLLQLGAGLDEGRFEQTGGDVTATRLNVGEVTEEAVGTYILTDGTLTTTETRLGASVLSAGHFRQDGGTHVTTKLYIGDRYFPRSSYTLTGGLLKVVKEPFKDGFGRIQGSDLFQSGGRIEAYSMVFGRYDLSGGELSCQGASFSVVSDTDTGYHQTGGQATADWLAFGSGEHGIDAGIVATGGLLVAAEGGTFTQAGGTVTATQLELGVDLYWDSTGRYVLQGGQLMTERVQIGGDGGNGVMEQTGGAHIVTEYISLAHHYTGDGSYGLSGGVLTSPAIYIGRYGWPAAQAQFAQSGGTNTVGLVHIEPAKAYILTQGELHVTDRLLCKGTFAQSGGVSTTNALEIPAGGSYGLTGGELHLRGALTSQGTLDFGGSNATLRFDDGGLGDFRTGTVAGSSAAVVDGSSRSMMIFPVGFDPDMVFGTFHNDGITYRVGSELYVPPTASFTTSMTIDDHVRCEGTFVGTAPGGLVLNAGATVSGTLDLGPGGQLTVNDAFSGISGGSLTAETVRIGVSAPGTFTASGGAMEVHDLFVSAGAAGALNVAGPAAITVSGKLAFGPAASFSAVPGAVIHMTGSVFENAATDPAALSGLNNVTMVFEGGAATIDTFEVAGMDLGPVAAGLRDNFALHALTVGGTDLGRVQLVDLFDNQPGKEALYVRNLNVGAGSELDAFGRKLYYRNGSFDPTATLLGNIIRIEYLQSVQAAAPTASYFAAGGGGVVIINSPTDIAVGMESRQIDFADGSMWLACPLLEERSDGGLARGLFGAGEFLLTSFLNQRLLSGEIIELELFEDGDGSGVLTGRGTVNVTGGEYMKYCEDPAGMGIELTLHLPGDIADFASAFSGSAAVMIVPEPGLSLLLMCGALAALRRRVRR